MIIDHDVVLRPAALMEAFRQQRITATFLTTALFAEVVREAKGVFEGMRYLLFGGELADPRAVAAVSAERGPDHLIHVYGPTEGTTFSTWHEVDRTDPAVRIPPIGRPISNASIYILDSQMQPVPVGIPGEIYIGGAGLGRGYWRRPEITAEKFVPNPYSRKPGSRLYRTGDMARYLADGRIDFLGRIDFQVKVRGFRIELGEIESHLLQHPSVKGAVVIVRGEGSEKRILAYVTLVDGASLSPADIKSWLRDRLPEHARPAAVTILQSLPLTANGKLERKALPEPERDTLAEGDYAAPRDATEESLCRIWGELLKLEHVGVHDDLRSGRPFVAGDAPGLQARARSLGWKFRSGRYLKRPRWPDWLVPFGSAGARLPCNRSRTRTAPEIFRCRRLSGGFGSCSNCKPRAARITCRSSCD